MNEALNSFDRFDLCKNNDDLDKCCRNIMAELYDGAKISHRKHKFWSYFVCPKNDDVIKEIVLKPNCDEDDKFIELIMVAGDTMNSAKQFFKLIDEDKFSSLISSLKEKGFRIEDNFHFSTMMKDKVWLKCSCDILEYFKYWKNVVNKNELKQISRKVNENELNQISKKVNKDEFVEYFNRLVEDKMVNKDHFSKFNDEIVSKKYKKINVCPSITFKYFWSKEKAIKMDAEGIFVDEFRNKVNYLLDMLK